MVFTKPLRDGVRRGEITCSVRIWTRPHVKVDGRYRMDEGEIEIDSIEPIGFPGITPQGHHENRRGTSRKHNPRGQRAEVRQPASRDGAVDQRS